MQIALRHSGTDEFKMVSTGWSWSLFLGAGFLGLPLFFRGLATWGTLMLVICIFQLALPFADIVSADGLESFLNLLTMGLCAYFGFRGNALSARHLMACGYEFVEPTSPQARFAAERWGI